MSEMYKMTFKRIMNFKGKKLKVAFEMVVLHIFPFLTFCLSNWEVRYGPGEFT